MSSEQEKGIINKIKNNNWWISILLAIPIGILANVLTPAIQDKYSKYSENAAIKRIERIKTEYTAAKYYSENREEFSIYMSSVIIKMTMIGTITTIAVAFFTFAQSFINRLRKVKLNFTQWIYSVIILFVAISIYSIAREALREYDNVKNFKEYEKMILKEFE